MQYHDELERALARPDAARMCRQLDAYESYFVQGSVGAWPKENEDDFSEIIGCYNDDPDKAFAYVILGVSQTDDAEFLRMLGCGPLEDVLCDPTAELLDRIVAEARKSSRFRWLLSNPFKVAIAPRVWEAIEKFRITGRHDEPSPDKLPPRK